MWGLRYLVAYAIGTVVGVVNEFLQKPHQPCYTNPKYSHTLTCGAANVYGWSLVALTGAFDLAVACKAPTWLPLVMVAPVLTATEALAGKISGWYFGEQRWKYPPNYLPACNGYISALSSLYFAIAGIAYWFGAYKPLISKL